MRLILFFILFLSIFSVSLLAQKDTVKVPATASTLFPDSSSVQLKSDTIRKAADTTKVLTKKKHDPRKATFRSAVLPGWGQIYNHEYWKLPIVYGALAIPASLYFYNNSYYKKMKFGYEAVYAATVPVKKDSSLLPKISPKVKRKDGTTFDLSIYESYRNIYKRDKDYSLLWFIVLWGVNVADATVFAHLKDFDVSDDLTLHINPTYIPSTKAKGVSLVFNLKNPAHKMLPSF